MPHVVKSLIYQINTHHPWWRSLHDVIITLTFYQAPTYIWASLQILILKVRFTIACSWICFINYAG